MRALQLPDSAVNSYFLTAFGRPPRAQTRESERSSVPTITQALHIFNGDTLNGKLRAPGGTVDMLLKLGLSDEQIVNYLSHRMNYCTCPGVRRGNAGSSAPCERIGVPSNIQ